MLYGGFALPILGGALVFAFVAYALLLLLGLT